ncbi:MAG: hypothetical protein A3H69_05720 [Candidatus Sungbacteria bacterium RIFCSPLOWO2_02_FULL_47_9]|uniref:EfeO-type cupredoxin-like domain-containing protein n=1 Tax=Candidatus Sungbacteria bacterium RIFCSPHIGHO2_01_FULL_47_32 TaxID=1802264 RepID=A0A1G2KBJ1_9BACT|nr:MAG: Plastocyanin [Parcubacteria group bacterium GW2011_GWA2_47_10]OGZ95778.1 MAG: hypothetical protein A2633_00595 [Candidatus Sungbacteria bacterium RIFCSPHIGHO2_01_FULL_47_32]OHA04585.1 MAG: hypothetical protein A3A28_01340 [Candidatus Sungbacteria bacterium RIFCSPLOWO2_01_FULL_47_32]OHA10130.1 MAG: hypothetical protein A3H69_05720 [Candidatus Sungbacteria bacterium RIFCSPLOWO2_02_FULL_47_9]
MNKRNIIIAVVVLAVAGVAYYAFQGETPTPAGNQIEPVNIAGMPVPTDGESVNEKVVNASAQAPVSSDEPMPVPAKKEFTVSGQSFSFSPSTITVNRGDKVKIVFKDQGGFHDLRIDGYNTGTQRINTGGEAFVEFTADRVGSFEYYCSVGSHRASGMHGTLIVQ